MAEDGSISALLDQVFEAARERGDDATFDKRKLDFVFHMTDWQQDLEKLHSMYMNPAAWDPKSACTFIIAFLYHVIPHLNAAGRLLVDVVPDPFSPQQRQKEQ